jgi:hypothetical protein
MEGNHERLPMPHGFDPLADDPYHGTCPLCGEVGELTEVDGEVVCVACVEDGPDGWLEELDNSDG